MYNHQENLYSNEKPLRILHLEDSFKDAEIIREKLIDAGFSIHVDRAANEQAFTTYLECGGYDLIFLDYHIPGFGGLAGLKRVKTLCPDVPAIFISGVIGEDMAVEILKDGATDYVLKDRLNKLPLATSRAIEEASARRAYRLAMEALTQSEEKFRKAFYTSPDAVTITRLEDDMIISVNTGYRPIPSLLPCEKDREIGRNEKRNREQPENQNSGRVLLQNEGGHYPIFHPVHVHHYGSVRSFAE